MEQEIFQILDDTPVGALGLVARGDTLVRVLFLADKQSHPLLPDAGGSPSPVLALAVEQLRAYFAGWLQRFDLPLAPQGTVFQKRVWRALIDIPYGETRSYGAIAQAVGAPKAARAVGMANGRNPLAIVVPCHRVIGNNGRLVGFNSGLAIKTALLEIESGVRAR